MTTFITVYLAVGFLIALSLFGWIAVSSVRRHGFRSSVRGATHTFLEELPLYWRTRVAAWVFVIVLPLIAAWEAVDGDVDATDAISLAVVWLLWFALLRWHLRAKARARHLHRH